MKRFLINEYIEICVVLSILSIIVFAGLSVLMDIDASRKIAIEQEQTKQIELCIKIKNPIERGFCIEEVSH